MLCPWLTEMRPGPVGKYESEARRWVLEGALPEWPLCPARDRAPPMAMRESGRPKDAALIRPGGLTWEEANVGSPVIIFCRCVHHMPVSGME